MLESGSKPGSVQADRIKNDKKDAGYSRLFVVEHIDFDNRPQIFGNPLGKNSRRFKLPGVKFLSAILFFNLHFFARNVKKTRQF